MQMKSSRALVFGAVALAAIATAAQQGVLLRRELKADAKDVYKIETAMSQKIATPQGDQDLEVKSKLTYSISTKKVDAEKGQAEVETETVTDKVDLGGSLAGMIPGAGEKVPAIKVTGKLDNRGRLVTQVPKMDAQQAMFAASTQTLMAVMFVELPEKEVKVGDSWTITLPKNPFFGDMENKLNAQLSGEKTVEGVKVWVVNITGQLKTDTTLAKIMSAMGNADPGQEGTIKGTADVTGEGLVDQTTGKTVALTTTLKTKNSIDIGFALDMTGTGSLKVNLAK
jgi:hypothetical protein